MWEMIFASHEAGWLSFYDYFDMNCALNCVAPLRGLIELGKHCGWWAPYKKVAIIQHRHCELHRNERGRLHNPTGMAVKYRDGWGIYRFHGVKVPAEWTGGGLTIKALKSAANAEQRRVGIEVYGRAKFLRDTGAKVLHADIGDRADARALVEDDEAQRWLVCTDGSTGRTYTMLVPAEVTTCAQAYVALCGVLDDDCVGAG